MKQQRNRPTYVLAWVLVLFLVPSLVLAGGVVEELRPMNQAMKVQAKQGQESHHKAGNNGVQEAPPTATPTATTPSKDKPELISLFYDPVQKRTVIRWKAFVHSGQRAIQYHIYRWSLSDPTRRLIAKVDGKTLEFVDTTVALIGEVYFYDIVGIYHIDGKYQSWQYPSQRLTPKQVKSNDAPAQAGIGCSTLQRRNHRDGWFWLLLLPFLALLRRNDR